MSSDTASLDDLVDQWLRWDPNPDDRRALAELRAKGDRQTLEKRMRPRISFGTAGLRASMTPGPSGMNDLTVLQSSQGLAAYLLHCDPQAHTKGIVVGHDHRHHSRRFADITAAVFMDRGFRVYLYEGLVHTPMVPFAVGKLGAAGGIMITASHNPKDDNGYKVYWSNAVQIIPPHDAHIRDHILAHLEPELKSFSSLDEACSHARTGALRVDKTEDLKDAYFREVEKMSRRRSSNASSRVRFVYTAMHGVGTPFALRALQTFGYDHLGRRQATSDADRPIVLVEEQCEPDAEFPTVRFPNPEEKGALDLAMKRADAVGASIVLANDPDADRFCAAERTSDGWHVFTGDQIGALFAKWVFEGYKATGRPLEKLAMINSTVSSKLIQSMAKVEGFHWDECLTGFKWIGNLAKTLQGRDYFVGLGYEEAIGYMLGSLSESTSDRGERADGVELVIPVYDKDGVTALANFVELVNETHERGGTLVGLLGEMYDKYGRHVTNNSYFVSHDPKVFDKMFRRLRYGEGAENAKVSSDSAGALRYPSHLGPLRVTAVRDLTVGYDSSKPDKKPILMVDPSSHMITFTLAEEGERAGPEYVLTLRTSGTEPKLKYYAEAIRATDRSEGDLAAAIGAIEEMFRAAKQEM